MPTQLQQGFGDTLLPAFVTRRLELLIAQNYAELASLLHDHLSYVHATGVRHDKAGYLWFVQERIRLMSFSLSKPSVWMNQDVAVVTGELEQSIVRVNETLPVTVRSWVSEVWRKGNEWQLYAFQSTRLAAE